MSHIVAFSELSMNDVAGAGGKGASLGEMTQAGIPVPPGYVVLADAFDRFLKETGISVEIDNYLHEVDTQAMHTVENASEQIQAMIKQREMPDDLKNEILEWRKNVHETNAKLEEVLNRIVQSISETHNVDAFNYTDNEVRDLLDQNITVDTHGRSTFLMCWKFDETPPYWMCANQMAEENIQLLEENVVAPPDNNSGIHGMGIGDRDVSSQAAVMSEKQDIKNVPENGIVVANVLEVEDLTILKKKNITGIITDEGGLTSHVAITAQELGVPAVIGTKNATQKIHNGDMLRLDPRSGIVEQLDNIS